VRDLGGLPLDRGGETRWGSVVRADSLADLSPAGVDALRAYGVRRIVDLRTDDERDDGRAKLDGIDVARVPIPPGSPADPLWPELIAIFDAAPDAESGLRDFYLACLDRWPASFAAAIAAIAEAGPGVVAIHCVAGRDRTGLVAALLLDAAGVTRTAIAGDYALTPHMEGHPDATARVMTEVLAALDRTRGGTPGYLLAAGLQAADIDAAVARLL